MGKRLPSKPGFGFGPTSFVRLYAPYRQSTESTYELPSPILRSLTPVATCIGLLLASSVGATGCSPMGEAPGSNKAISGFTGGENLTNGRYDWIRFTFLGGDYQIVKNRNEVVSVTDKRTQIINAEKPNVRVVPSTLDFEEREGLLVTVAMALRGFDLRVTSDVAGDDAAIESRISPSPELSAKGGWSREVNGDRTVEVVVLPEICEEDECQQVEETIDHGEVEGWASRLPFSTGKGSPIVFVRERAPRFWGTVLHEIGHAVGLRHSSADKGIMSKRALDFRHVFQLFETYELIDEAKRKGVEFQRPIDYLGPGFGILPTPLFRPGTEGTIAGKSLAVANRAGPGANFPTPYPFPMAHRLHDVAFGQEHRSFLEFFVSNAVSPEYEMSSPRISDPTWIESTLRYILWRGTSQNIAATDQFYCKEGHILMKRYECGQEQPCEVSLDCHLLAPLSYCRQGKTNALGVCADAPEK